MTSAYLHGELQLLLATGGLCVVPGMHTSIEAYVRRPNLKRIIKCSNFTRLDKCSDLTSKIVPGMTQSEQHLGLYL